MNYTPKITTLNEKKLIGTSTSMDLIDDKTLMLWQRFGPRIKEIQHRVNADKISMQIYPENYFNPFRPTNRFTKWACVEVDCFDALPKELLTFTLTGGLYAVFYYQGAALDNAIYHYIFSEWIPKSNYTVANRPHFEVLGAKYSNTAASSEEEIWIPISKK